METQEQTKKTQTASDSNVTNAPIDIFNLKDVAIELRYHTANPTIFYATFFLPKEVTKESRAFVELPEEEQKKQRHTHNVSMLAHIATRKPEGLGIDDLPEGQLNDQIRLMFSDENNPMKVKVASDLINAYFRATMPVEMLQS